jgi:hypothetical protein
MKRVIVISKVQIPRRTRVSVRNLKHAIKHAINYENTDECQLAWERIDEMDLQSEERIKVRESTRDLLEHPESTSWREQNVRESNP